MLENARVTVFIFFEVFRENQQGGGGDSKITPSHPK